MNIKLTNLFSNEVLPNSDLKGGHGQSFFLEIGDKNLLFDVGGSGKKLLANMKKLNIPVDSVQLLAFSHGHYDHTQALPAFLAARNSSLTPLPPYGHPAMEEKKYAKIAFLKKNLGFPSKKMTPELRSRCEFHLQAEPLELLPGVWLSGEIKDRPYHSGEEKMALHLKDDGTPEIDPVKDDQSLYLKTSKGTVIVTGCAHAGLLNICRHAKELLKQPIHAIIGGSHMVRFTPDKVEEVADVLKSEFDSPTLYLNHCTEFLPPPFKKNTFVRPLLREKMGDEKILPCYVGTKLEFA
ncbi:MAG: MBL fold metallo-hydrolase [Promethearchaeota archaeon]